MKNQDLGKTQISDTVRVSSAAVFYEEWFGAYWQYETFIFSKDPLIKSRQVIHGTCSIETGSKKLTEITKKVHGYIANNLLKSYVHV